MLSVFLSSPYRPLVCVRSLAFSRSFVLQSLSKDLHIRSAVEEMFMQVQKDAEDKAKRAEKNEKSDQLADLQKRNKELEDICHLVRRYRSTHLMAAWQTRLSSVMVVLPLPLSAITRLATFVYACKAKRTTTHTQLHTNTSKREGRQSHLLKCVVARCRVYAYMHASHTFGCNEKG